MSVRKGGKIIAGSEPTKFVSGHTIGEIFYTSRLTKVIAGAVEANGDEYSCLLYSGEESVPSLLKRGELDYVSFDEYESIVSANGSCRVFGWDNGDTFRVPTAEKMKRVLVAKKEATASDLTWYNLYSDGWIEQGYSFDGSTASLTFLKPFKDTSYSIAGSPVVYSSHGVQTVSVTEKTTTGITWAGSNYSSSSWVFCGYAEIPTEAEYQFQNIETHRAMVQLATGVKEDASQLKEYKFNNPHFFGESKWSDIEPNNASWLVSNGQWNSKSVYPDYYDWLVEQMNAGVEGFKSTVGYAWKSQTVDVRFWTALRTPKVGDAVYGGYGIPFAGNVTAINSDGTLNFYEVSTGVTYENLVYTESENINVEGTAFANLKFANDYDFVVNTTDETFRLPLLNGSEDLISDKYEDLILTSNTQRFTAPANGIYTVSGVGFGWVDIANETSRHFGSCSQPRTDDGYGRYTVKAKQGDQIAVFCRAVPSSYICRFVYAKGNGTLYYYVGDTLQDASLINAGAMLSDIAELKQTDGAMLSDIAELKQGEAKLKSMIRLVTELPETPEEGVLYCIAEG